jgi:hypothetical protein
MEISLRPNLPQDSERQQYLQYCRIIGSTHSPVVLEQAVCRAEFEGTLVFIGGYMPFRVCREPGSNEIQEESLVWPLSLVRFLL